MNSTTEPTGIDDLPAEMICELFKHLPLNDLATCSAVNKRWHSIYAGFRLDRLAVICYFYYLDTGFHPNRTIADKELCDLKKFSRLIDQPLLSNLKRLLIATWDCPHEFDLNRLNGLKQLVHLETYHIDHSGRRLDLNLPKLKTLAINETNYSSALSIDCPELNVLVYHEREEGSLLSVKHPETIIKLDTNMFGAKLAPFKNVQCLVVRRLNAISKHTLLTLPRLEELHYNESVEEAFWEHRREIGTLNKIRRTLSQFLEDLEQLTSVARDFKFTFAGFQLTRESLSQLDFGLKTSETHEYAFNEHVYPKNYPLLDPGARLEFIKRLDYTLLMEKVAEDTPNHLFKKFIWLRSVEATAQVQDPNHLLGFLNSLKPLESLVLVSSQLGQEFYDQLPVVAHSLIELNLREDSDELQLNFEFISQLPRLSRLRIDRSSLTFESLCSLAKGLAQLREASFRFQWGGKKFSIKKYKELNEWQVFDYVPETGLRGQAVLKTEHPKDVLHIFERLPDSTTEKGIMKSKS